MIPQKQLNEVVSMSDRELAAAYNIVYRQVNAKLFVGDRQNRIEVLEVLNSEKTKRGY